MKKQFMLLFSAVILTLAVISVSASAIVSPALNILAKENKMIKSGLRYSDVYFSEQDFKKCLGIPSVDSVKIESLPDATVGTLKLGTLNVTEGQTVKSQYLSLLRFVPASETVTAAEMVFSCDGTEVPCSVRILSSVNYAPYFSEDETAVNTYRNVSCYGSVRMSDPEGDDLSLQVITYPSHGSLVLTDASRGNYCYTPSTGYIGNDAFVVVACDAYGNYSAAQTVNIGVEKTNVFFTDMRGHWSENAAISLYTAGVADAVRYQNGLVFCPDENVSREEFITMAMKALKITTLTDSSTSFADNEQISKEYRPYVATAQRMGYVNGKEIDGKMCFDPKGSITKAEAAVLLQNMLGYPEGEVVSTFADDGSIPAWAKGAVYALTSAGVFNGDGEGIIAPSALLSRAQTTQMLYNLMQK